MLLRRCRPVVMVYLVVYGAIIVRVLTREYISRGNTHGPGISLRRSYLSPNLDESSVSRSRRRSFGTRAAPNFISLVWNNDCKDTETREIFVEGKSTSETSGKLRPKQTFSGKTRTRTAKFDIFTKMASRLAMFQSSDARTEKILLFSFV